MKSLEQLKEELRKERAQAEVRRDFRARDEERKELQRELFALKHRKGIAAAWKVRRGVFAIGKGIKRIRGALGEVGKSFQSQQRPIKRKPIRRIKQKSYSMEKEIRDLMNIG